MPGMNQNTSVTLRALAVPAELAEQSGLSRRTIELVLDPLVEAGWVSSGR
ncbi:hypothetical protein AB0J35_36235 [Nonomuraea angiospora]